MKNLSLASVFSSASMQSCTTIRAEVASTWMFFMAYLWSKATSVFDIPQDCGKKFTTNVHHWYPGLDVAAHKKNNEKGICNRAPLSNNCGTFVILMRSTDPATAGPKYFVTSRLLLEEEAMVFHAPLVATWSSNACHTHINHALTKQRSCR